MDKLEKEKKTDRAVHIFARSIQMLDYKGRIMKRLAKENEETIRGLLDLNSNPKNSSSF